MTDERRLEILRKQAAETDDSIARLLDERIEIAILIDKTRKNLGQEHRDFEFEMQTYERLKGLMVHKNAVAPVWSMLFDYLNS